MIRTVIFLIESPFNKRDYKRFGAETLISSGFHVQFWDFTPFINPTLFEKYIPPDSFTFDGLRLFYSKNSAIGAIKNLNRQETLVVTFVPYQIKTFGIYKAVSSKNLLYGTISSGTLPSPTHIEDNKTNINYFISRLVSKVLVNPLSLAGAVFNRIPAQLLGVKPMDFLIMGGDKAYRRNPTSIGTKFIHGCTFDYDLYLLQKRKEETHAECQYKGDIIFLDNYAPFHPDIYIFYEGGVAPFGPEQYYSTLVEFFEKVENLFDSRVVIAAHPRSDYESLPDYFDGRKVVRGATQNLVKNSKWVITHESTAVSFAVIYRKPILFTTLNCIEEVYTRYALKHDIAHSLCKNPVNLDSPGEINWQAELEVNQQAYKLYLDSYIKCPSAPEKTCWEIFADYAKDISEKE